jgi:hypothetical protein
MRVAANAPARGLNVVEHGRPGCPKTGYGIRVERRAQCGERLPPLLLRRPPEEAGDLQVLVVVHGPDRLAVRHGPMQRRCLDRHRHRLAFWRTRGSIRQRRALVRPDRLRRVHPLALHLLKEVGSVKARRVNRNGRLRAGLAALRLALAARIEARGDDGDHDLVRRAARRSWCRR